MRASSAASSAVGGPGTTTVRSGWTRKWSTGGGIAPSSTCSATAREPASRVREYPVSPPAAVNPRTSASARIASMSGPLRGGPTRRLPLQPVEHRRPIGGSCSRRQREQDVEHLPPQCRDGAALRVRAEHGDEAVALTALADQARLARHREPGARELGPARCRALPPPAVVLGGGQVGRLDGMGGVDQAGGGGHLGDQRRRRFVDAEVLRRPPQVTDADATRAQLGGWVRGPLVGERGHETQ